MASSLKLKQLNFAIITPTALLWTLSTTSPGRPPHSPGRILPPTTTDSAMPCQETGEWVIKFPSGTAEES